MVCVRLFSVPCHLSFTQLLLSMARMAPSLQTSLTQILNIQHPIILAGMARTSSAALAAAVSNAGGCGVIGGLGVRPARGIVLSNPSDGRDSIPQISYKIL